MSIMDPARPRQPFALCERRVAGPLLTAASAPPTDPSRGSPFGPAGA
jgi:hypothetical protein